jgi:hypothetical protein
MRVKLDGADDALRLTVVDKANNPKDVAAATKRLEAWEARGKRPGGRVTLRLTDRTSLTRAQLSHLRAAYLVAFTALGWRYVLGLPYLNLLRAQLADPDAALLPPLDLLDLGAPPERRQLLIVREPAELHSLAVVLGRYTVFLPWIEDPQSFEDLAAALKRLCGTPTPPPVHFSGKEIPWPAEPRYALDR